MPAPDPTLPPVDLAAATDALQRWAGRLADLVTSAPSPTTPLHGSDWDVREVAKHVTIVAEAYTSYAAGKTEAVVDMSDIAGGSVARSSAALLAAEPEGDLEALAHRLRRGADAMVSTTQGRATTEQVMWNGTPVSLGTLVGLALAEFVMHGKDLARSLRAPWPIGADDAHIVLSAALPLMPLLVNPHTTAGVQASFEIRIRGGNAAVLRIDDGTLAVGPAHAVSMSGPVDCHISADPVALLLVSYGRMSKWQAAGTGKMLAWGRRPWLGLRLTDYLVNP